MNFSADNRIDASVFFPRSNGKHTPESPILIRSFRFQGRNWNVQAIHKICRDEIGRSTFLHFEVETLEGMRFNLVFDTEMIGWYMISEPG